MDANKNLTAAPGFSEMKWTRIYANFAVLHRHVFAVEPLPVQRTSRATARK